MKKEDEINRDFLLQIINKYLNGTSTIEEEELLINYYESFQKEEEWNAELGLEEEIKHRIHSRILSKVNNVSRKEPKVVHLNFKKYLKYAAAILIFLSLGYYAAENKLFNSEIPLKINNTIEIGTDKATLTLEDGSNVLLEKGKEYKLANAKSDGEKLVYSIEEDKNTASPTQEITYNYLTVPRGGHFYVELADGTNVWLNSETKFKYPTKFIKGQPRTVELLYGEAYFDVSHSSNHNGAAFKVNSGVQEIEVLGTEFNVKFYQDDNNLYTTLVKGKVALNNNNNNNNNSIKKTLKPGQQSILNSTNNDITIVNVDVSYEIAWKNGLFMFDKKSLKEIMVILSRWYDIKVVFENKSKQNIIMSGLLKKSDNIEELLKNFERTGEIKYSIQENTVLLK